ncbi:class I SAM-dependent methyltransferase [Thermocrispum sp.]|jgi:ubiquinone/menaquinone biosynthesis C-methylase UbiE|uniref:class I SAM-dependent methyltransferase n=1 Tax=Thermocrispum sp. TaxID=2060768 RepID=UPI002580F61B|nr:class I SAM-dependent methyltransferase [Thermocrispum sp.]
MNRTRWARYWDRQSARYDAEMMRWDKRLFGDSRSWACSQARGNVLEVAVGTGLNLPHYPPDVRLTGIDFSAQMLALAERRATGLGRPITLLRADAQRLPLADDSFDTVVCTFGLCAIPDHEAALDEIDRVLRDGGRLILVDHVVSTNRFLRAGQWLLERITVPLAGENFRRRPLLSVQARGYTVQQVERFRYGLVERLVATREPAVR